MKCYRCNGSGVDDDNILCYRCGGKGEIELTNEEWLRSATTEELAGNVEKHILMGEEARSFYNYITEPLKYMDEYEDCNRIIRDVCALMYEVKTECKII